VTTGAPSTNLRAARLGAALTLALAASAGACGDEESPVRPSNVTASVSDAIATVVQVQWTTGADAVGYVEFGPTPALGLRTPMDAAAGVTHAATLLGLTGETVYYYRAVSVDGSATVAGDVRSIRTKTVPLEVPLTTTGEGLGGFIVVPVLGTTVAVVVLNAKGEIVWYHTDDRDLDFYRARLSVDGKSLLYNAAKISGTPSEASALVRVALDGSGSTAIPIPYLAHDFVEHPDGTLAAIAIEYRDFEGKPLAGNRIVEVTPDGGQRTAWTSWDCFDPAVVRGDAITQDWTFANALDYDPVEDVYYLGMRDFSSIARINRKTRACEWVLGLGAATFTFAPGSVRFLHQHQFQVRGNRVVVMDNDGAPGNESRVLEYELDVTNQVARQVWSFTATPSVYSFVFGEPARFDDGRTFINWGAAGQFELLDPGGNSVWKLNSTAGIAFGFHVLAESLYSGSSSEPGASGT